MLTKSPVAGAVKTRLTPPLLPAEAAALARAMIDDLVERFRGLALRLDADLVIYFAPADARDDFDFLGRGVELRAQGSGDLGERMHAVFAQLRADGYAHVVLVGADSPTLPDARLSDAFALLDAGTQVAIARADDGGYVLLGLDAAYPQLFEAIAWSTSAVYATTLARARACALSIGELEPWYDVDTQSDLDRLRHECSTDVALIAPRTCAVARRIAVRA